MHTPGPWSASNLWLGPEGKGPFGYPLGTDPDIAAANARLIAAAPRMLEALRIANNHMIAHAETCYGCQASRERIRAILRDIEGKE